MKNLVTRKQLAEMVGIPKDLLVTYSKTKYTHLPKAVMRQRNIFYYDKKEAEQWVENYKKVYVTKELGLVKRRAFYSIRGFQLTLDQQIDLDIRIMKAKKNKPITQTVHVKEIDLYARP